LSGDEFAVILENTDIVQAQQIAERMRAAVDAFRFTRNGRSFALGLSIGVVRIDGQQPAQALLAQADIAMYSAKEQGRNRVVCYQPADESFARLSEASQWATRIKDALYEGRFTPYFLPVVRFDDGQVDHYELLIRMREGDELIPPGAFIPAAERFGLMPQLDQRVVELALDTLARRRDISLCVNISGRSLLDESLVRLVDKALRERGIAPARLAFEISEAAAVQDIVRAERWIHKIAALGCSVAIDDFGIGFSSFTHLRSLPVDRIKIDGSYIRGIHHSPGNRAIVQAIHTLAEALGKATVAEFVEQPEIAVIMREIGVTYGQGYFLGGPEPSIPEQATALAREQQVATTAREY
jgi:EAL domain-containing protein (putative c-di-GMP-specific phosphodiesterase class I)